MAISAGASVFVTGGAGFLGSHVVDALLARGCRVTAYDNLSTGFLRFLSAHENLRIIESDLLDFDALTRAMQCHDMVFHLAANADIKDGLLHPRKDVEQNILATQNVLEAMRQHGVRRIGFTSTGSVYGEPEVFPTPEAAPFPIQTSLYAASKVAGEGLLTAYAHGYGFQVSIFRLVSLLGPRYTHGHVFDFYRKLRENPEVLDVLGDGHQRKSYLHVHDCVAALLTAVEAQSSTNPSIGIYNISHPDNIEVNDSIAIICDELGVKPQLRYSGGTRGWIGDSPKIALDSTRLRKLGWTHTRTIEESIRDTLRFLVANPFCLRG